MMVGMQGNTMLLVDLEFFDPLADKVLTGSALFAFTFLGVISFWGVFVITFRDVYVTVLRIIAEKKFTSENIIISKMENCTSICFYLVFSISFYNQIKC